MGVQWVGLVFDGWLTWMWDICEGQLQQKHPRIEQTQSQIVLFFPIPSVVLSCYTTFLNQTTQLVARIFPESWIFLLAPLQWSRKRGLRCPVLLLSRLRYHAPALAWVEAPRVESPRWPHLSPRPSWKMTTRQRRVWRRCWAIRSYICKKTIHELHMWRVERKQFQHLSISKESSETSSHVEYVAVPSGRHAISGGFSKAWIWHTFFLR